MKFVGLDQITTKMVKKAAERTLIKFFLLAIGQSNAPLFSSQFQIESNHYDTKTAFLDLIIFLRYLTIIPRARTGCESIAHEAEVLVKAN